MSQLPAHNTKIIISYDGTRYLGWQETQEGPSIEGTLRQSLERILQHPVILQAASRTDQGVHAHGQVVNFFTPKTLSLHNLNGVLPKDIAASSVEIMPESFHPTLDCNGKEYHYHICNSHFQNPIYRLSSWHCYYKLNLDAMREAAQNLIGEHDFAAYCNYFTKNNYDSTIRRIDKLEILPSNNRLHIKISGNHFLYKMVRNIVGTLVFVGRGKLDPATFLQIKDRRLLGVTAPAHGLYLHKVLY